MCGIIGYLSTNHNIQKEKFIKARDIISHRGPDDKGLWISPNGHVGLGHRRLSIIDLSKNAKQPMQDDSSSNIIVFNGEIYNYLELRQELIKLGHSFASNSDTEVILKAYKAEKISLMLNSLIASINV